MVDSAKAFSSTSRILYSRPFRELVAGLPTASGSSGVFGAPTVAALLAQSIPFATVRQGLQDKFAADFAAALEYAHVFDSVRPVYEYGLRMEAEWEEYHAQGECECVERLCLRSLWPNVKQRRSLNLFQSLFLLIADHTADSLGKDFARLRSWDGQIDRMRSQHVQGSLFVDSKRLRAELEPVTARASDATKALAQELARARCASARESLDARIKLLEARPSVVSASGGAVPSSVSGGAASGVAGTPSTPSTTLMGSLERYVSHATHLRACREGEASQAAEVEGVEDLYRLLQSHGSRIVPDDAVALDDLRHLVGAYGDAVRRARGWADDSRGEVLSVLGAREAAVQGALRSAGVGVVAAPANDGAPAGGLAMIAPPALTVLSEEQLQATVEAPDCGGVLITIAELLAQAEQLAGWREALQAAHGPAAGNYGAAGSARGAGR